jgi:hypothetical protein
MYLQFSDVELHDGVALHCDRASDLILDSPAIGSTILIMEDWTVDHPIRLSALCSTLSIGVEYGDNHCNLNPSKCLILHYLRRY